MQIEILGRAAVPALKLLSEKTGVSLGVMPEDVKTLGERKLTIIAQGCTLKALHGTDSEGVAGMPLGY